MKLNGLEKYFKTMNGEIVDFKQLDNCYYTYIPLNFVLRFNKSYELNLNSEQLDYLIKNSDLKKMNTYGYTSLNYALENSNEKNLSNKNWKYLIEYSDLSWIIDKNQLIKLRKIQSDLLSDEILNKIDINKKIKKNHKI